MYLKKLNFDNNSLLKSINFVFMTPQTFNKSFLTDYRNTRKKEIMTYMKHVTQSRDINISVE